MCYIKQNRWDSSIWRKCHEFCTYLVTNRMSWRIGILDQMMAMEKKFREYQKECGFILLGL